MGVATRMATTLGVLVAALVAGLVPTPAAAAEPIANTVPPVISGEPVYGRLLQTSPGTWTPDGLTLSYAWSRDGQAIPGEDGPSLRLGLEDLGSTITATVTAAATDGSTLSVTTEPTPTVRRATFELLAAPTVSGVSRYTRRVTATAGEWSRRPTRVRYQWLRSGEPIQGATRASYRLGVDDVGERVRVQVTVRREGYRTAEARSAARLVRHLVPVRRSVTYSVITRGRISADLGVFKQQVQQTYDDPRGWRSAGVEFRRVSRGGTFTVVLAQASTVPSFSSVCSVDWSCRVGRYVIINQTRWQRSSPSWRAHDLPRRSYRHMVVNHETGHWLGHGHLSCGGSGRLAPVMMQQSKGLAGCRHNPWPLASERWSRIAGRPALGQLAGRDLSAWAVAG